MSVALYLEKTDDNNLIAYGGYLGRDIKEIDDTILADTLSSKIGSKDTGILPPVVRYISMTKRIILFERPPGPVSITFHGRQKKDVSKARSQEYDLFLPTILYGIVLDQHNWPSIVYMFIVREPVVNGEVKIYELPFPNIYADDRFCLPDFGSYSTYRDIPLAQGINTAYELIWSSNFNTDLSDKISNAYRNGQPYQFFKEIGQARSRVSAANIFTAWSRTDPNLIPGLDYVPARTGTVNGFLSTIMEYDTQASSGPFMMNLIVDSVKDMNPIEPRTQTKTDDIKAEETEPSSDVQPTDIYPPIEPPLDLLDLNDDLDPFRPLDEEPF